MIYFADYAPDGRILRAGGSESRDATPPVEPGCQREFSYNMHTPDGSYWDGEGLRYKPPQPSANHVFNYTLKAWAFDSDKAWAAVRSLRDQMLAKTDWRLFRAQEQGIPLEQDWVDYRQALRDVTEQADPGAIVWPEPPAG